MRNYYVLSNGRVQRKDNTVFVENAEGQKKPIPVEDVDALYLYGEIDLNTRLLNFLAQKKIVAHVFNYYGFYSGSFYPREYLHSGYLLVRQVNHYTDKAQRMTLAREFVKGSAHSLLRNLAYYANRKSKKESLEEYEPKGEIGVHGPINSGQPVEEATESAIDATVEMPEAGIEALAFEIPEVVEEAPVSSEDAETDAFESSVMFGEDAVTLNQLRATIAALSTQIEDQKDGNALRGLEGKMRERYYHAWRHILNEEWVFDRRVRRPPDNEVNALISFGNSHLYTVCLGEIYRTQLTPTISYLHEPGGRRFSLALDLSEIFKPLLVDRAIFRLINTGQLQDSHFDKSMKGCFLTDSGKKLYLKTLEERLATTIHHRRLGRHVSYRHLIRLECYKLVRHLTDLEPYKAFRAWW